MQTLTWVTMVLIGFSLWKKLDKIVTILERTNDESSRD